MAPTRAVEFDHTLPGARRRRRAFTTVEILTVVGIIVVLVGIAAVAYRTLDRSAGPNATRVTLQNLQAMLAEYEAAAGLRDGPQWVNQVLIAAGERDGNVSAGAKARFGWDAIGNTQRVYQTLRRIPANKQVMDRMPANVLLGRADDVPSRRGVLLLGPDGRQLDPPLVADSWNNPIIFVGSQGLVGVDLVLKSGKSGGDPTDFERPGQRVTSVRTSTRTEAVPVGARPFFASAGPDGNFRTGDDNVYSFEQQ